MQNARRLLRMSHRTLGSAAQKLTVLDGLGADGTQGRARGGAQRGEVAHWPGGTRRHFGDGR